MKRLALAFALLAAGCVSSPRQPEFAGSPEEQVRWLTALGEAHYGNALELDDPIVLAVTGRAPGPNATRELDRADAAYTGALRIHPRDPSLYLARGTVRLAKKTALAAAIADFSEALRLNGSYEMARTWRVAAYEEKGDFEAAVADLTEALRRIPFAWDYYVDRSRCLLQLGRLGPAIQDLETALKLRPESYDIAYNLGNLRERAGDWPGALAAFTRAVQMHPLDPAYRIARGFALSKLGRNAEAEREYRHLDQNAGGSWNLLARAEFYDSIGRKDRAEADRAAAKRLERAPSSVDTGEAPLPPPPAGVSMKRSLQCHADSWLYAGKPAPENLLSLEKRALEVEYLPGEDLHRVRWHTTRLDRHGKILAVEEKSRPAWCAFADRGQSPEFVCYPHSWGATVTAHDGRELASGDLKGEKLEFRWDGRSIVTFRSENCEITP